LIKTATIASNTRELIVQLSRGNADPAHALAQRVHADLNVILSSDLDAASTLRKQARQTMFAIEEVLVLVDQSDLRGAWEAARDAAKEWRKIAQTQE
jgi:predicted amino acid racemase